MSGSEAQPCPRTAALTHSTDSRLPAGLRHAYLMCGAMSSGAAKTSTATRVLASDIHPNTRSTCGTPLSVRSADYVLPGSTREYPQSALLSLRADALKHKAPRTTAEPQRRPLSCSFEAARTAAACRCAPQPVGSGRAWACAWADPAAGGLRCAAFASCAADDLARALQVACAVCCMRCRLYALYVVCAAPYVVGGTLGFLRRRRLPCSSVVCAAAPSGVNKN